MASLRRSDGSTAFTKAFTLIELLVVIAIIAILTAILLPVFASVRENSRQGVSISNLKDIQQKMEQFKLDNHRYPDVLFGYAYPGTTMKTGLAKAQLYDQTYNTANPTLPQSNRAALYFPGLYPAYIKDVEEFTDPNNTVKSGDTTNQITIPLTASLIAPCNPTNDELLSGAGTSGCGTAAYAAGSIVPTLRSFYIADAYDSSPQVTGANMVGSNSILRYQIAREGTACSGTAPNQKPLGCDPTVTSDEFYKQQLRWQTPPADAFITCTTYHVKNADKVLVMFESGAVKKITGEDFAAGVAGQANGEPANFWKLTP